MIKLYAIGGHEMGICTSTIKKPLGSLNQRLNQAILLGNPQEVSNLLQLGADVNNQENDGSTPIHLAIAGRQINIIRILLKEPKLRLNDLQTSGDAQSFISGYLASPLAYAIIMCCNVDIIELIASDLRTDVNLRSTAEHLTPLEIIIRMYDLLFYDQTYFVPILVKYGASLNCQNKDGETALMQAINMRYLSYISALLSFKPDLTIQNQAGQTALMVAEHLSVPVLNSMPYTPSTTKYSVVRRMKISEWETQCEKCHVANSFINEQIDERVRIINMIKFA